MPRIIHRHLPNNFSGRDLIAGDLHGCPSLLLDALGKLGFDPSRDRVFSTGDLTDRGQDSPGALRLLDEPWFHPVRGNHEQFLIDTLSRVLDDAGRGISPAASAASMGRDMLTMDAEWLWDMLCGVSFDPGTARDMLSKVSAVPHVLSVGTGPMRFHVAHAGVPDSALAGPDSAMARLPALRGVAAENAIGRLLWERTLPRSHADAAPALTAAALPPVPPGEPAPVFLGHTVVPRPQRHGRLIYVDTGCGFPRRTGHDPRLTVMDRTGREIAESALGS